MIKLISYFKPFIVSTLIVIILIFIQSLSELFLPTLMSDIVDIGIVNGDIDYIFKIGVWMILITAVGTVSGIAASYLSAKVSVGIGKSIRSKIFTKVEHFSLHGFDKLGTSSLITRTTNDVTQIQNVLIVIMRTAARAPILALGGIILAITKDAQLSKILIGVMCILAVLIFFVAKRSMRLFKALQFKLDKLNLVLREYLTGIRVIRAFNREKEEKSRFYNANTDLTDTAIRVNKLMAFLMPSMMLLFNFTTVIIFWFGSKHIDNGIMQVGDLMAFIQYAMQIMFSLVMFTMMFIMIPRATVSAGRINELLETKAEIVDPQNPIIKTNKRGYIEFKDVSFYFLGAEKPALEKISFKANPGEVTAIVGSTGSGKSTLANLIMRFYDVSDGQILIDDIDIRDMDQKDLRSKIGYAPQNTTLFTGTIAENIRFGKEDASDEEVENAAKIAQAMAFIKNMNKGFESEITQGGTNISGGQKQRLSIARVLIRKPEIYIFDDSFSALDFKTDAKLRQALRKETSAATVIIIAQRISTVMDADRIIVLDNGKVAGIGTHKRLLKTCSVYKEIVSSQLSEEEIA